MRLHIPCDLFEIQEMIPHLKYNNPPENREGYLICLVKNVISASLAI